MANKDTPRGFDLLNPYAKVRKYYKAAAVQLGVGDPVVRETNSSDPSGRSMVTRATTGSYMTGVVTEVIPHPDRAYPYLKSGDTGYVMVADDPNEEFIIQDNGGASGLIVTQTGQHVDFVAAIDCSTTGRSKYELDTEAVAADNTLELVELLDRPDNAVGANAKWIVKINLHTEANAGVTNIKEI